MDGDNWKVVDFQSSDEESFDKNNLEECTYHEQDDVKDVENDTNEPTPKSEVIIVNSSDESLAKSKSRFKFPWSKAKIMGKSNPFDRIVRNIYITTGTSGEENHQKLNANALECVMEMMIEGKVVLRETLHGIIISFTRESDCDKVIGLNMSRLFGKPIILWNIPQNTIKYQNVIIIKEIPWCVSIKEIENLLKAQGIFPAHISRGDGDAVRVVARSCSAVDKFIQDGFNFFDCITLPVFMEPCEDADLIQCYKCQRFWHTAIHCPFHMRCVRCGQKHDVRDCPRSRKNPLCCLCGLNHHAAYKLCPIRIKHLTSIQVDFSLFQNVPPFCS